MLCSEGDRYRRGFSEGWRGTPPIDGKYNRDSCCAFHFMDGKISLREGGQGNAAFIIMPKELLVDTIHLHVEDAHGQSDHPRGKGSASPKNTKQYVDGSPTNNIIFYHGLRHCFSRFLMSRFLSASAFPLLLPLHITIDAQFFYPPYLDLAKLKIGQAKS